MSNIDNDLLLLNQDIKHAQYVSTNLFTNAKSSKTQIILYGAGGIGKRTAHILTINGNKPSCFIDNNISLHGSTICTIPVLSLKEATHKFDKNSLVIITVFNRELASDYKNIYNILIHHGFKNIIPYSILAFHYAQELLPYFAQGTPLHVIPYKEKIYNAVTFFNDFRSLEIIGEFIRLSLTANFETFSAIDEGPEYFTPQIINTIPELIYFADCGAYNGDTLRNFLNIIGSEQLGSYYAFEPDPSNFIQLKSYVSTLPTDIQKKIFCINAALGDSCKEINFLATGQEFSKISSVGNTTLHCVTLDSIFYDNPCNFIKLDVEGYENETIYGSQKTIKKYKPILCISLYHKTKDFFEIPIITNKLLPYDREQYIKRYGSYFFDTVYYNIPIHNK